MSMEKSTKRSSIDSKRSIKMRHSKSSKNPRNSLSISSNNTIIEESNIDDDGNNESGEEIPLNHYRANITQTFFESFYLNYLVDERKSIKTIDDLSNFSTSSTLFFSSVNNSLENSFTSMETTSNTVEFKNSWQKNQTASFQSFSGESTTTGTTDGTLTSCASNCMCFWKIKFKNGNRYEGQLNETNLMEGKGIFYWTDGTVYKGDFKDGYPTGFGKLLLPDLSTYEGEFSVGFFHGQGILNVKSTPILYNGQWRLSERNGKGWLLYESDNWYEGEWLKNKKNGLGYRNYRNHDKFNGNWLNDEINGEGCMMWNNNDYYKGEWSNNLPHGYGEYIWNVISTNSLIFPNYNWYKGNWVNGTRTGAGIMNFGHESGAKLAGTWTNNLKNGPGVMVCGNGMTLAKNPLFIDDKPAPYPGDTKPHTSMENCSVMAYPKKSGDLTSFAGIAQQINSKSKLDSLSQEPLNTITRSGINIKMKQYIKLLEKNTGNPPPLKIPIHNIVHEVDLQYFCDFLRIENANHNGTSNNDISTLEIENMINRRKDASTKSASYVNYLPSNAEFTPIWNPSASPSQQCILNTNELMNLIINYLPQLRIIYRTYATICNRDENINNNNLEFEPVLVRIFLWQFFRDIEVCDKKNNISIVEIDRMLYKNPNCCLENAHFPWEPIYFWQFLQTLLGVASLLFIKENKLDYTPTSGFMYHILKNFLEQKVFVHAGYFQGNCLTNLKDLVPIEEMYNLYKDIGEPHTIEELLNVVCLNRDQKIPCYKMLNLNNSNNEYCIKDGANATILNNQITYLGKFTRNRYTFLHNKICCRKKSCKVFLKLPKGYFNIRHLQ